MTTKPKHIFYFDALRATAIICVIIIHVTEFIPNIMDYTPEMFYSITSFWKLFSYNSFRIGVPLFLMLSGALSLGRDWEIKGFLAKRLPRIIKPFLFWSIMTTSILIIATYFIPRVGIIENFSILTILKTFMDTFLFRPPNFGVYWFFWMILGTYLAMPIFNKWIFNSELKEVEYFLVIWIINSILEYTLILRCPIQLSYFTSPIGIVILGYYLRHTKRKIFNNKYIALLMIIIPIILMIIYSYHVLDPEMFKFYSFKFDRYSILMIIEATGVFCLYKCSDFLKNPNIYFKKFSDIVAKCSYGMYLTHYMFIHLLSKLTLMNTLHYGGMYTILLIGAFFGSLILIYALGKIPIIKDFVGIK